MPTQLTTETATLTTATIQIQTLAIGKKQVTLAVFRQLREEPLIATDGTLNGVPWGVVNYHPDKCADAAAHWHVVWQHGTELLRSHVERDPFARDGAEATFRCRAADRLLNAHVHAWIHTGKGDSPLDNPLLQTNVPGTYRRRYARDNERLLEVDAGIRVMATASSAALAAHREEAQVYPTGPFERGAARAALDAEVEGYGVSMDQLWADVDDAVTVEVDRRRRHRETRKALAELPQLFIAV
ncbi:hypothetical protein ABZ584_24435 [Streptomyces antibioticus]|uniref:hypothetical protein n=1 Tax=Streptomyces antibioticus TaxID=1890 RepID=UPI0033D1D742